MRVLELYKGTGSVGAVCEELGFEVVSLDIEKKYKPTIIADIMKWDYKKDFKEGDFDLITTSPVCLYWSRLRNTWIGRKCKSIHPTEVITKQHLLDDIEKYGKPMVDKTFEIIDYLKPKYWWLENPNSSSMWKYIDEKHGDRNFETYIFDYCKYSNWGYKKPTRFITNYKGVETLRCKNDCENIITIKEQKIHSDRMGTSKTIKTEEGKIIRCNTKALREKYKDYPNIQQIQKAGLGNKDKNIKSIGRGSHRDERYRIPHKLIKELLKPILEN